MKSYSVPEILRVPLEELCLHIMVSESVIIGNVSLQLVCSGCTHTKSDTVMLFICTEIKLGKSVSNFGCCIGSAQQAERGSCNVDTERDWSL